MRVHNMKEELAFRAMRDHCESATSFYKIMSDGVKNGEKDGRSKRSKTDNSLQRERSISHDTGEGSQIVGEGGIYVEPTRNYP